MQMNKWMGFVVCIIAQISMDIFKKQKMQTFPGKIIFISVSANTSVFDYYFFFFSQEEFDQTVVAVQSHSVGAQGHFSRGVFLGRHLQDDQVRG